MMKGWTRIGRRDSPPETSDVVIVGSGYGGSIAAARLAEAGRSVCVLERGIEWLPGDFPDTLSEIASSVRRVDHRIALLDRPLGLFEYLEHDDIDVLQGCGLGGTSLINANVAIRPDRELFEDSRWPVPIRHEADEGEVWRWYDRAEEGLQVGPHPEPHALRKVDALRVRASEVEEATFGRLNLTVNFDPNWTTELGEPRPACTDCGDCIIGCNVGAKSTLRTTYLARAQALGVDFFTAAEVSHIRSEPGGGYTVVFDRPDRREHEVSRIRAGTVVLAAGSIGSTRILLRSAAEGLRVSRRLGQGFSGNGDFFGIAYNTARRTNIVGYGTDGPDRRTADRAGPSIVGIVRYDGDRPFDERITVEDLGVPSAFGGLARTAFRKLGATGRGRPGGLDGVVAVVRKVRDILGGSRRGALNHSMVYLVMGIDDSNGRIVLSDTGQADVVWPDISDRPLFERMNKELGRHAACLGGTYVENPRWSFLGGRNLVTAHPLGGCGLGDDPDRGVVDDRGRVFDGEGGFHPGLHVVDGSIVPMALGVNPFLTISALAERAMNGIVREGK